MKAKQTREKEMKESKKFPGFPYEPYPIQIDFMNALYGSLDRGGVSILESPTGTGKTLSIICSTLQWVFDRREKEKEAKENDANRRENGGSNDEDEPDWMRDFVVNKGDGLEHRTPEMNKINKKGKRREDGTRGDLDLIPHNLERGNVGDVDEEREFLLEEYESEGDGEEGGGGRLKRKGVGLDLSSSSSDEGGVDDEEDGGEKGWKVYFCSRTHSQLTQFVKELRKTGFGDRVKVVSLGSRKNLCVNEEVLTLGSATRINERCLELQKNSKKEVSKIKSLGTEGRTRLNKASCGCPMLRKHKLQRQFRGQISQGGAFDIEDLVLLGRRMGICPYYGSRSMVPAADIVVLPYQSLLSKSSRESLGLNLKNHIVIIDEAHNLADSLISMYDAKITLSQLEHVQTLIEKYFARFRSLLGPGNRRYVQTLMVLVRAFLQILNNGKDLNDENTDKVEETAAEARKVNDTSMAINDFLFSLNIDNINLVKLVHYIRQTNLVHKVSGYGEKLAVKQTGFCLEANVESDEEVSSLSSFRALVDMLLSLTNNDGDGRIIISRARSTPGQQGGFLKYVMLTGEKIFSEIVREAHAVVLAGGTLQPIGETRERLFPWLPPDQLHLFSCGHIVPTQNILPIAVSRGPSGQSFDFSFISRSSSSMVQELGLLLCNLVTVVPEGMVVFFSSFEYERQVYDLWKASGILERVMKKKRLFREPRRSSDVELVLKEYKETIDQLSSESKENATAHNGAIFLAVVGGKISEGINFSDGMGRCIVMVGLPYPSPFDIELMERVKYIENLGETNSMRTSQISLSQECDNGDVQAAFNVLKICRRRGKEYYENLCMKAVNQSIGRAIRHVNDYAAILLVDTRYSSSSSIKSFSNPANKLPAWIKDRLVSSTNNYGEVHRQLHQFFKLHKGKGHANRKY